MNKITHERIKQIIIEDEPFRQDEMLLYVEQQEKLDEYLRISYDRDIKAYSEIRKLNKLLELYKEALETNFEGITLIKLVNKTLRTQIKELENE